MKKKKKMRIRLRFLIKWIASRQWKIARRFDKKKKRKKKKKSTKLYAKILMTWKDRSMFLVLCYHSVPFGSESSLDSGWQQRSTGESIWSKTRTFYLVLSLCFLECVEVCTFLAIWRSQLYLKLQPIPSAFFWKGQI